MVTVEFFFFVKFLMSSRPVYLFSCGKPVMRNFFHKFFFLTNNLQKILESVRLYFCITAFLVLGNGEAGMPSFSATENLPCWAASWIIHKNDSWWLLFDCTEWEKTDTRLGRVPKFHEKTITFVSGYEHYSQTKGIAFIVKKNFTLSSGKWSKTFHFGKKV